MLILGNKYQLEQKDYTKLEKVFTSIHNIDIQNNNTSHIIQKIKNFMNNNNKVSYIILNLEKKLNLELEEYLENLDYNGVKFLTYSNFHTTFLKKDNITLNQNNFTVLYDIQHNLKSQIQKRVFDFIFALFALIFLSPIFILISISIKIKSPNGDIFFGHQRVGKDGKLFRVYKFRTMIPNAEEKLQKILDENPDIKAEYEKDFKLKNDPRIIPYIGNFLRKTSLDELPQFFNALIGNLSIVGPRPIVSKEVQKYGKYSVKLYSIKPGITGLWQVSGRNDISYQERVTLDMKYIDNQSFWLDLKIILKTIKVMILREGV